MVVSSLSPGYIDELLTGSQRPVSYVVLPPMLDSGLGRVECYKWADGLVNNIGVDKVDLYKKNMLRNLYMLFSGHPRSLENMVKYFKRYNESDSHWNSLRGELENKECSVISCLTEVLNSMKGCVTDIKTLSEKDLEKYVFTTPKYFSAGDAGFRRLTESGKLMVYRRADVEFEVCVQGLSLIELLVLQEGRFSISEEFPHTRPAFELFKGFNKYKTGVFWERIISFTIASRSYDTINLSAMLGIDKLSQDSEMERNLVLRFEKNISSVSFYEGENSFIVPPDNQPGFDGLVLINTLRRSRWYLQCKVSLPSASMEEVVAKSVCYCLRDLLLRDGASGGAGACAVPLSDVHVIFYLWNFTDHDITKLKASQSAVLARIPKLFEDQFKDDPLLSMAYVTDYLESCWDNVHFVGETKCRQWLPRSFLPFPILFTEIGEESDAD